MKLKAEKGVFATLVVTPVTGGTQRIDGLEAIKDYLANLPAPTPLGSKEIPHDAGVPQGVTAPKKARKAPAKSLLPTKPWNGGDSAWIDFRCIADPTTGAGLVKALKRYISLGEADKWVASYLPYTAMAMARPHAVGIAALSDWGTGYVDRKYLKALPEGVGDPGALAAAYRSAYRSWVKRQEAKKAKAREANIKAIETAAKEVFAGGWTGKTAEQVRAERILKALEAGYFYFTSSPHGNSRIEVYSGPLGEREFLGRFNMKQQQSKA